MRTARALRPGLRGVVAAVLLLVVLVAMGGASLWTPAVRAQTQGEVDTQKELAQVRSLIQQSVETLRAGNRADAYRLARAAYLDHFELIEVPLRVLDPNFTLQTEYRFAQWRSRIQAGAPVAQVEGIVRQLEGDLNEVDAVLQGPGVLAPLLTTLASFTILFREGLEAILILAALLRYVQTHQPTLGRPIWLGAGLAVPASVLTWFVLDVVVGLVPLGREVLGALVSLLAFAVLFYVSFWLLQRLETRHWMEFLRSRVWEAVAAGNAASLFLLGFVSVYREGAETALFYQALLLMVGRLSAWILFGIALAVGVLAVIGWAIFILGARVPVRTFLGIAVTLLMLLSIGMLGNAVWEFQDAGVLPVTSLLDSFPRLNPFLANLLGLHPSAESLVAQALLLLVYLAGGVYVYGRRARRRLPEPHPRGA